MLDQMTEPIDMTYSNFAHPLVQDVLGFVQELQEKWHLRSGKFVNLPWENINNLVSLLMRSSIRREPEMAKEIFQYFAAAVIYSECLVNSFQEPRKVSQSSEGPLFLRDDLKQKITIPYLNNIAKEIETELFEKTYLRDQRSDIKNELQRKFQIREEHGGQLASISSKSNIPYLKVFADHEREVYIRNGLEVLTEPRYLKMYKFHNANQKICNFPYRFFRNGSHDPVYKGNEELAVVFGNKDDSLVNNILNGKCITSINVHLPNYSQHKKSMRSHS